ncbi:MAG: hypothetical protein EOO09_06000 [Chitinophagaceae bacterium]|nr:MAG: hypothetical protein EOO09_06000 [Chitinophagaceae bacterium]
MTPAALRRIGIPAFLLLSLHVFSQPHIGGTVRLDTRQGLIECDFRLSGLPALSEYRILLNHGMNIQYFRDDSLRQIYYDGWYGGRMKGEALEYVLMKNDRDTLRPLPSSFRIRYRGAFPVYNDTLNIFDFKGLIAFNGKTVRATEQSKWYPVIYDVKADRLVDTYTYSIRVESANSKTIYLNGSAPVQQSGKTLVSNTPRALFLFAGDYGFIRSGKDYLLNVPAGKSIADKIFAELNRIKVFHAKNLGITYNEGVYLINHEAVKKYRDGQSWGFTVFPSFAYAHLDFTKLVDSNGKFNNDNLAFFAHELSHYYFGGNVISGNLQWFWLESTTEYLSLKAAEALADTAYYNGVLAKYSSFARNQQYKPLSRIVSPGEIDENYRYVYGPLIWICYEKTFGLDATYKTLAGLVRRSAKESLSLETLRAVSLANGIRGTEYDRFYSAFLDGDAALLNVCTLAAGR